MNRSSVVKPSIRRTNLCSKENVKPLELSSKLFCKIARAVEKLPNMSSISAKATLIAIDTKIYKVACQRHICVPSTSQKYISPQQRDRGIR